MSVIESAIDTTGARLACAVSGAPLAYTAAGWEAKLALRFESRVGRTVLVGRSHSGPLVVQKALYPEGPGICHAVIIHPPGGVAGGDRLCLTSNISGGHALLTTPGAGKWYKANDLDASQALNFTLTDNAVLEWLPQETILFDGAQVQLNTTIELDTGSRYAGWEILCFGRRASGERFNSGRLRQQLRLVRSQVPIWGEFANMDGGSLQMTSPVGLNNCSVAATFVIAAGLVPADLLTLCRAIEPPPQASYGVTGLPEVFAARYLGNNAQQARHYFEALWAVLRPWYAGVPAERPRLWNT